MAFLKATTGWKISPLLRLLAVIALLLFLLYHYQRPKSTIVVKLRGRLGNQLFQVAAAETHRHAGEKLIFVADGYSNETDFSQTIFSPLKLVEKEDEACHGSWTRLKEQRFSCDNLRAATRDKCIYIDGFFQCTNYAANGVRKVDALLRNYDEFPRLQARWRRMLDKAGWKNRRNVTVVGVHVRRGDYLKRFNKGFLEALPADYYQRSVQMVSQLGRQPVFMLFSDDVKWVTNATKELLPGVSQRNIVIVREQDAVKSLILLSFSDAWIIANSTFSWWAAFVGQLRRRNDAGKALVVAPKKWFGERVKHDVPGLVPPAWITL